ncbi:F0F1 ATP synthase subunit B' [compost metagenome]
MAEEAQARYAQEEAAVSARIAEAEAAIARTRDAAMVHVSTVASDTAHAMIERLTGKAPTAAEVAAAVKGAA